MPTGYTEAISEGITFEDFVMRCARAFGACVTMRDDPPDAKIPEAFEPSPYYKTKIIEAQAELEKLKKMTIEEASKAARIEYNDKLDLYRKRINEIYELKDKYEKMLAKVQNWKPPTPDHIALKEFMIDQIKRSIDSDCNLHYYVDHIPMWYSGEAWLNLKTKQILQDIEYYTEEQQKEEKRVAARNLWLKQLRNSLKS